MLFATQLIIGINVGLTIEPLAQPTVTDIRYAECLAHLLSLLTYVFKDLF